MKYYIIAGEASGDLHGGNLIKQLKRLDPACVVRAWGGENMEAAGAEVVKHYRDLAFMGFIEVLVNIRTILTNLSFCKKDIAAFKPDTLVLIDYPGFNLQIAKWAHSKKIKVIYYISPQVWAWKSGRVRSMKKTIDKMLVILPFEKNYYKKEWNWDVVYVGHPLVEAIDQYISTADPEAPFSTPKADTPIVALLPGSRKQEIRTKLPIMLEATKRFPNVLFVVAKAPGIDASFYQQMMEDFPAVQSVHQHTYSLLRKASAALVTSGTATLETALFGVPQIVCYKGNPLSYWIAKKILTIKYISLVNLILDKPVVLELIQNELNVSRIEKELDLLLTHSEKRTQMAKEYASLRELLYQGGENASRKAAEELIK